jgi:hypothetical protein
MSGMTSAFDASASAIGYLYQLRYALLAGLNEFGSDANWQVSVEIVDDVEVVADGQSRRWQLKHRAEGSALTNGSTDLWKTLRIWSDAVKTGSLDPSKTRLLLLTTSTVPVDSVADYLQAGAGRDVAKARELLNKAAAGSSSKTNEKSIQEYLSLTPAQASAMLESVTVLGAGPDIDAVRRELLKICSYAVGQKAEPFLEYLEGWFIQRCIETMRSDVAVPVLGTEIDEKFSEIRSQFGPENLPIDPDVLEMTATKDQYSDSMFVRQLDLIGISDRRVERAVRDYLRAYTQRSRWVRKNMLIPGELGAYERRLQDEWETLFGVVEDELGPQAAEESKMEAAKKIYRWVETELRENIRPECADPFVCKGSMHILADGKKVGWHPDFEARLLEILEPAGGAVNANG